VSRVQGKKLLPLYLASAFTKSVLVILVTSKEELQHFLKFNLLLRLKNHAERHKFFTSFSIGIKVKGIIPRSWFFKFSMEMKIQRIEIN